MKKDKVKLVKKVYKGSRRTFKIGSLQSIITLSFTSITLLAMIFIGIAFYSTFSENAEKNAASSMQQIMNQATINLENYLHSMIEITNLIQNKISTTSLGNLEEIDDILSLTLEIREDIVSVSIYTNNGNLLLTTPKYQFDNSYVVTQQNWFLKSLKNPSAYIFQPPHVQRHFEDKRPWVISLNRGITTDVSNIQQHFITNVDMNFSVIEQLCSDVVLGQRGYIYIVDSSGNIIYHPQQQLIYAGLKKENIEETLKKEPGSYLDTYQGEKRITTVMNIEYANWTMVGISFLDEIIQNRRNLNALIFIILLFGIVFIVIASIFISFKISQPIKRLENQMNKVERGDFNIDNLEIKGEDEVKQLTKAFNLMIVRIKQLMSQIISEQEAKRKSEIKALQAQINPHFLYNTLDSIIWMNENKKYDGVSEMTAALAKLFRISLSKGNETISICDEIEHARSYLIIQKIRYKNKFDYKINLPNNICQYKTVKLIIQPIIENAIYHGINKIQETGHIIINVVKEDAFIKFEISDNGYGITKENIEKIMNKESTSHYSSGVGLKNVNERIKLSYGNEYGIKIDSEFEVGTTVSIKVPLVTE